MVTATCLRGPGSWSALFALNPQSVSTDWFGAPLPSRIEFFLGLDGERLWFGAAMAAHPDCAEHVQVGDFIEGLWERDVAELFLAETETLRYREFNLSPRGAWWSCAFSAPRVRESAAPPAGVETCGEVSDGRWRAGLAVPLRELGLCWSEHSPLRANMTACLEQPQRFVTVTKLAARNPDFHLPGSFPPLTLQSA